MSKESTTNQIRAEHDSLPEYLHSNLTAEQLSNPLIASFSQWEINTSVIAEIAANLHEMGLRPTLALWSNKTPMRDVGWTTDHRLARMLLSPSRDQNLEKALLAVGLPKGCFAEPPIQRWRPGDLPAAPDAPTRSTIRPLEYRRAPVGKAILQVHPETQTPVTDNHPWPRGWIEASTRSFAWVFDQSLELITSRNISCVFVFNGRFLHDAAVASAARAAGIPVLAFDFGGNDTDFDLTVDDTHDWVRLQVRMKEMYEAWDPVERVAIGGGWFEDRRQHTDPRNTLFTESQTVGRGLDLNENKRVIVFFSSSGDEISELDVDWSEYFHGQPGALKAVAEICRSNGDLLVVRTHPHKRMKPKLDVEQWYQIVQEVQPDIHVDEWSDIDSYALMDQADVVVTYGSTTGVEAGYAGRPVIVLGPSAYDVLGCAVRPRTIEELGRALSDPPQGNKEAAMAYGLMMKRRGFNNSYVHSDSSGRKVLGSHVLKDSRHPVLVASDISKKFQHSRLTRGAQSGAR